MSLELIGKAFLAALAALALGVSAQAGGVAQQECPSGKCPAYTGQKGYGPIGHKNYRQPAHYRTKYLTNGTNNPNSRTNNPNANPSNPNALNPVNPIVPSLGGP